VAVDTAFGPAVDQPTEERRSRAGRTALVALLTVLVLAGLAFGGYRLLAGGPSNSVTVPSVVGSTRQVAEQVLRDAGLQPAFRNVAGDNDGTVGTVIGQTPDHGVDVAPGTTVTAEVNVGPATERIPKDLVGRDVDEVVEELTDAGFSNVTTVPVADPPTGAETDEVVAVDPPEGEKAAPEQDITVSYVGRAARAPTSGTEEEPRGDESSRPSETESTADEEQSEEPKQSSEPSDEASSDEPSDEPSESAEPEPSQTESSEPEPSESASSGGAPSADASSVPPGEEEVEDPKTSVDPADATPGSKKKPKPGG